ncbi:D-alanine--D-alanine ligase [Paenibacillus sp. Marseille-Q7038]
MLKVGVIMGGISSEVEVSLNTGREMMNHLDPNKYEVIPVVFSKPAELVEKVKRLDIALLALHGAYGEDGTIQGMLETLGIPYTGSGVLASSLCMDKDLSKKILRYEGVNTPGWLCWNSMEDYSPKDVQQLGYPVMVKPNTGGSSIGMEKVNDEQDLHSAVMRAFASDPDQSILIERYITGQEMTCSILDGEVLPMIGITSASSEWFDYSAKYEEGGADEVVVNLPQELDELVRKTAMTCYQALKCSVYARVDILLSDGVPYVLEMNTLPGMTKTSLLPKSAAAAGISFSSLLDRIISCSLKKAQQDQRGVASC